MLRPDTLALTALLALLTAVGPMSVDLYLPSLPELGRVFGASVPQVQLTLSGYLLCFAIGQIVFGPISDHVGRKPVLLAALSLYVAVCLSCMFATSIEMLIALRCLQALGVAGAPVLARAIVRDLYQGVRAGRELARMGSITALAPVVAPSLGGILQSTFGWRASFLGMAALGLCAIVLVIRLLPETMKQPPKHPMSLPSIIRGYGIFLRHRTFRIYLAIVSASYGGLFAWISGSSFVLQDLMACRRCCSAWCSRRPHWAMASARCWRRDWSCASASTAPSCTEGWHSLPAGSRWRPPSRWARPLPPRWRYRWRSISAVSAWPCRNRWRVRSCRFRERAGAASSLLGFLQQATASAIGIVVGQMLGSSALPLAAIIAAMGVLALALALFRRSMGPAH